jgi:predicted metal-dependent HD superfamily phosphohydrolase
MHDLMSAWYAALPDADPTASGGVGAELLTCWAQPHRRYHTSTHLAAVLAIVQAHAERAEDLDAVRLAAWYHDAVYDPARPDNEERSAELAASALPALGVPAGRVTEVARLVLLTAAHDPVAEDRNGCLLCDADLAILAAPPAAYATYAHAIREEYAHLSDEAFHSGRSAVLHRLLDTPALFRIPELRAVWEKAARANLSHELATLEHGASAGVAHLN